MKQFCESAFARACLYAVVVMLSATSHAQNPASFDVISVKLHKPGETNSSTRWTSTGYEATNTLLRNLIANSYGVKTWLVFGLPPWAESARWDVQAKVIDPAARTMDKLAVAERRALLSSVLKERFGLVAHTEQRVQPVFELTMLPEGAKFKQSPPLPTGSEAPRFGRERTMINDGVLKASDITMDSFADTIAYQLDRSIVNRTGLTGEYDLQLKWTPEDRVNSASSVTFDSQPAIFEALKEQLGLKLTQGKAPVPAIVLDRILQPEAN